MTKLQEKQNIPKEWRTEKVETLFEIGRGRVISKEEIQRNPGPYPVYSSQTSNNGEFGKMGTYDFDGEYLTWTTDGIYAGAVFYRTGKFNCTNVCGTLKKKVNIDTRFFSYALPLQAERHVVKTANPKLMNNIMARVLVPVPPIKEQHKIAEILGTVDEDIAKTQEVIEATEKLKRGLMQQLFTRGIGHTKFKETKIGRIPEEWEVVKLSDVALLERGKFSHRPRNAPEFYGGDLPFIQTGDVISSNGRISTYTQTLNKKGLSVSKLFKKGTIVITIAANIGDTGILQFDSCFPDSLIGITPIGKIDSVFLEYYLRTQKEYLNSISTQSAQKNINLEKLNPILVVLPSKSEQKEIAEILSALDEKILVNKKLKAKLTLLKKGLMQDLLSGKVRTIIS